jgi:hypothetical protein
MTVLKALVILSLIPLVVLAIAIPMSTPRAHVESMYVRGKRYEPMALKVYVVDVVGLSLIRTHYESASYVLILVDSRDHRHVLRVTAAQFLDIELYGQVDVRVTRRPFQVTYELVHPSRSMASPPRVRSSDRSLIAVPP